jgi:hypothetical protein
MLLRKKIIFARFCLVLLLPGFISARSFDDIFPDIEAERRTQVFAEGGVIRSPGKNESLELSPAASSGIDLPSRIMQKSPAYLTESLLVVPYTGRPLTLLDAYIALGKIRGLEGWVYNSHTRGAAVPLFEEATRIEGAKRTAAIPDPPDSKSVPLSETVYIRLKDANFGNSYYRADIFPDGNGIICGLSNFKSLTYLFFPVIKEEKFTALLYLEPLAEGMLVYSIAGADVSAFIASNIDIPSAIGKRLGVFLDWITDGVKGIR